MFRTIRKLFAPARRPVAPPRPRTVLGAERLETRAMMSVTQSAVGADGVWNITSDNLGDYVEIRVDSARNEFLLVVNGDVPRAQRVAVSRVTAGTVNFTGNGGNDTFDDNTGRLRVIARGGAGNDTLYGGRFDDYLYGDGDNDYLVGEEGDDWIETGNGNNIAIGDFIATQASAAGGKDTIYGGSGDDQLAGCGGNDYVNGMGGTNRLFGDQGNDVIRGGDGNDTLWDGPGGDMIDVGGGANSWNRDASEVEAGARRNLYVNFDGATIGRPALNRVFGTRQSADLLNHLDAKNDGITVSPLFAGQADREQIISDVMGFLSNDFSQFGMNVVRVRAGTQPFEGHLATTLYVGPAGFETTSRNDALDREVIQSRGVASETDVGNDNPTDVAFVHTTTGPTRGTRWAEAQYLANIAAHEVGHTLGLYHSNVFITVDKVNYYFNEASRDSYQALADQGMLVKADYTFLDREFDATENTAVKQNSYRTLFQNLGTTAPAGPGPKGKVVWQS